MTVDDVVYSLDRIRDPKLGSYVGWMLGERRRRQGARRRDRRHHAVSKPDALFEYALASTAAHVVNKAFVEANGDKYGTPEVGSIGTGPFKFVEWVRRRPPDASPASTTTGTRPTAARTSTSHDQDPARADDARRRPRDGRDRLPRQQRPVGPVRDGRRRWTTSTCTFAPSYYGEWITFNTAGAAVRQRQGPPGAQLRRRQEGASASCTTARTPSTPRRPSSTRPCGRSSRPPGRPRGTSCRPTTSGPRQGEGSCSTSRASPTS